MKVLYAGLMLCLSGGVISAQDLPSAPAPTDVTVIQKLWRVETRNPSADESALEMLEEVNQAELDRRQTQRQRQQNTVKPSTGLPADVKPARENESEPRTGGSSTTYVYEVKLKNNGPKAIQALVWEYVFSDPGTNRELGRRRFVSKVNIAPGKTKNLVVRSAAPPTSTIDAAASGKKLREQYSEKVLIQSVKYTDGSIQPAAGTPAKEMP